MAHRAADRAVGRIAVLGATSPSGAAVKAALADRAVPGERVALYGHQREVAVLSEYDGEARLVLAADELEAEGYAAVFVCDRGHDGPGLAEAAASGTLVIDMTGTIPGTVLTGSHAASTAGGLVAVPQPITLLLTAMLAPLRSAVGLTRASIFVLRPASDFGQPGLEELREQTIHLLRFESIPTEIFGRQLAFNVLPERLFPKGEDDAAERVVAECRAILGTPEVPVALSLALVPLFYGHAIAAHVELAEPGYDRALAAWRAAPGIEVAEDPESGAALDAPEGPKLLVARVDAVGASSLRIWAVGSEAGAWAAARAIAVAVEAGVLVNRP